MEYRPGNINMKIVIYLTFYLHVFSAGQSEAACTFPCGFRNKTFDLYLDVFGTEPFITWTFNADGSASTVFGGTVNCFQISEQFLVVRIEESSRFWCFPIFYTAGQSNFTFIMQGEFDWKVFENVSSALNESQLCEVCGENGADKFTVVAIEQPSSFPDSTTPPVCQVPSFCPSTTTTPCPEDGSIPKDCSGVTTNSPTTVTTDTPTTTTSEIPTTVTTDTPTTTTSEIPTTVTTDTPTTTTSEIPTTVTTDTPTTTTSEITTTIGTKKPCARRRHKHINGH